MNEYKITYTYDFKEYIGTLICDNELEIICYFKNSPCPLPLEIINIEDLGEYKNRLTNKGVYLKFTNDCTHEIIFRESIPKGSKWYCRQCFAEVDPANYY